MVKQVLRPGVSSRPQSTANHRAGPRMRDDDMMHRRSLIASGLALTATSCATTPTRDDMRDMGQRAETYTREELVPTVSDFLGVTVENAGAAIERLFRDNGRPTAYIAGEEASGAITIGARYGRGLLYMKGREPMEVFWQGPSVGWDWGGNASRVFTLCYNLHVPEMIYQRFPGVEGTAYLVGGLGVNYQRAEDITLAPIRAGVGLRLGANIGYLAYTRKRNIIPF